MRSLVLAILLTAVAPLTSRAADAAVPSPESVRGLMERVADWQLQHLPTREIEDTDYPPASATYSPRGWVMATADAGIMALADLPGEARYLDAMRKIGAANHWQPGVRTYHADDHCIVQTYAELFLHDHDPAEIAPSVERFDYILAHPPEGSLEFVGDDRGDRWAWCDSLFMAPPAWVRLWKATGNAAYLDYAVRHWWQTSDYLYDRDEHLFFRDSTYFKQREANGRKIFWSRGNGWVFAGLARVLTFLPANHPDRERFVRQFREMAAKLITVQQTDGFWRSSLLDPEHYPAQEESGTAFYCFGLAWGINHGLLDRTTYLPPALRAWSALVSCVGPDGRLRHVQPIGADPRHFDPNSTEPFGVGGFLLAGSEVYRLR